ncbi:hypothetical protein J6590_027510 [Homalodisca vitripennis]|nr:hypothetical protein J6590_027510 [Homalodisca vitripennis]
MLEYLAYDMNEILHVYYDFSINLINSSYFTVRDANELKNESIINVESEEEEEETKDENKEECEPMDDGRRVYNKKTLKDQHGNYPVWLSSRKIKKIVKKNNLSKRVQKKRGKK